MREEVEKLVKKFMLEGKQYLAKNDLYGFYTWVYNNKEEELLEVMSTNEAVLFQARLTEAFEKCGVQTLKLFNGTVPKFYCSEYVAPKYAISNKLHVNGIELDSVLQFPNNIKYLEEFAFDSCDNFRTLDLRGLDYVASSAFEGCRSLTSVIIEPKVIDRSDNDFIWGCDNFDTLLFTGSIDDYTWPLVESTLGFALNSNSGIETISLDTGQRVQLDEYLE